MPGLKAVTLREKRQANLMVPLNLVRFRLLVIFELRTEVRVIFNIEISYETFYHVHRVRTSGCDLCVNALDQYTFFELDQALGKCLP